MHFTLNRFVASLVLGLSLAGSALGQTPSPGAATSFADGQQVEVREGDAWSSATVVKREGRKYLIHYDGADAANDEWVTVDRVRVRAAQTPGPATGPATGPARPQWAVEQRVSVKRGGSWQSAKIILKRGDWTMVQYEQRGQRLDWVEPWRIRSLDSTQDAPFAMPHYAIQRTDPPPTPTPGPMPEDAFANSRTNRTQDAPEVVRDPLLKTVDLSRASALNLAVPENAQLKSDPYAGAKAAPVRVALKGARGDYWDKLRTVTVTRGLRPAAFVLYSNKPPGGEGSSRIEKLDLADGGLSVGVYPIGPGQEVLAASPDAKMLAVADEDSYDKQMGRISLYTIGASEAKRIVAFDPFPGKFSNGRARQVEFVDDTHLLIKGDESISLLQVPELKPLWTISGPSIMYLDLSPGGKYLAVAGAEPDCILMLDPLTGKGIGRIPAPGLRISGLSFSPSGDQLGACAGAEYCLFEVSSGRQLRRFCTPRPGNVGLTMITNGYALSGRSVIDFERRIVLWKYYGGDTWNIAPSGQSYWVSKELALLVSADLPHPKALAFAQTLKAEDLLLLKPGVKLALSANINADDAERQQAVEAVKKHIIDAGLVLDDSSALKLTLTTSTGNPVERQFHTFGKDEKVTVIPQISEMYLEAEGKRIWSARIESVANSATLKEGQSMQDAVNAASKPNLSFFKSAQIPSYITKPHEPAEYGSSPIPGLKP